LLRAFFVRHPKQGDATFFLPAFCYGSAVNVDLYFSLSVWAWGRGWERRRYAKLLPCASMRSPPEHSLLLSFFFFLGTLFSPPSPVSHNVFNVFASNVTSKGGHQTTESKIRQMFHYFTLVPRNTLLSSSILCLVNE